VESRVCCITICSILTVSKCEKYTFDWLTDKKLRNIFFYLTLCKFFLDNLAVVLGCLALLDKHNIGSLTEHINSFTYYILIIIIIIIIMHIL